jgi:hypothetical protein
VDVEKDGGEEEELGNDPAVVLERVMLLRDGWGDGGCGGQGAVTVAGGGVDRLVDTCGEEGAGRLLYMFVM